MNKLFLITKFVAAPSLKSKTSSPLPVFISLNKLFSNSQLSASVLKSKPSSPPII
jgi:hypothetical protein